MISGQLPGMTNALSVIPTPIDAQVINICIYPAALPSAGVVVTENGAAADNVTVTIPTSAATKLFARLKVAVAL